MHTLGLPKSLSCIELGPQWPMAHYELARLIKKKGNIEAMPNTTPPHLSTILKCPQCVHHVGVLFVLVFGPMSEDNVTMCCKMHIDCVNVEAPRHTVVQSRLRWILACHCVM